MCRRIVWTDEDVSYLTEYFPVLPNSDIAEHLGISTTSVHNKAAELGLVKSPDFHSRNFYGRYVRSYKNNINKIKL